MFSNITSVSAMISLIISKFCSVHLRIDLRLSRKSGIRSRWWTGRLLKCFSAAISRFSECTLKNLHNSLSNNHACSDIYNHLQNSSRNYQRFLFIKLQVKESINLIWIILAKWLSLQYFVKLTGHNGKFRSNSKNCKRWIFGRSD